MGAWTDHAERAPRTFDKAVGAQALARRLPEGLVGLADLSFDLWWTAEPRARALFERIGPTLFAACGENPIDLLYEVEPEALAALTGDAGFMRELAEVLAERERVTTRPIRNAGVASEQRPIAFFCSEFALHRSLPLYAGGLGVLAGDLLKEACDRAVPMIGVGLLYRRGYFHQRLDASGYQHEYWLETRQPHMPIEPVFAKDGEPLCIQVDIHGHSVCARIWQVRIGRVRLYLLDSDHPGNRKIDRFITAQLYVGDRQMRLAQYALLGIGGLRALRALGIDPAVVHLNEGHPAFAALELAHEQVASGKTFSEALEAVRARVVFTTHTPVAAGNETYGADELAYVLQAFPKTLGVSSDAMASLGRNMDDPSLPFGMTQLALRTSRSANAVSKKHGEVARMMWQTLEPTARADRLPIKYVTNGVHIPTWMALPMKQLLARHLGSDFLERAADPQTWARVQEIPDEELWAVRNHLRASLVEYVREQSMEDRFFRGDKLDYVEAAARAFDPDVLTVGFARRVATYKRLHLLSSNVARAVALLRSERPIQVLVAGKAHPRDEEGKRVIQQVFRMKAATEVASRVVFLEDYDLLMAKKLVAGCDIWINVPRPPFEASGTSGMKAMLNGGLNLSVLDGWWSEAWDGKNGWAIRSQENVDEAAQDAHDAELLYALLEQEVIPLFHARDDAGIPRGLCTKIKSSLQTLGPRFGAGRMLEDYVQQVYATT